ncbi:MAG TPA: ATP-binding protein [Anaerolineae bacterium]|nr:ATP-binding protein [Anaerolineae bacterium]
MMVREERHLTVPGRFESLARISEFVTAAAQSAGLDADDVFHVEMAVDEACSNVIEHAYEDQQGEIDLTCSTVEPGNLQIVILDHGQPFDPTTVPQPTFVDPSQIDVMQEGGLGLYFMRKLMDDVHFEFVPSQGNKLTMIKRHHMVQ